MDPVTFEFIERPGREFDEAIDRSFERHFDDKTKSIVACIFCKGKRDKAPYFKRTRTQAS